MLKQSRLFVASLLIGLLLVAAVAPVMAQDAQAEDVEINVVHMWSTALGRSALDEIFGNFGAGEVIDNSAGHEDFKTQILVTIAGNNPPDLFSYWAGARTQFVVEADRLMPLDDFWEANNLDETFSEGLKSAMIYEGDLYMIPMNAHIIGFFYNANVMREAGIDAMPTTWDEFTAMADTLLENGVTPIALGSRDRWPAQFWFDYLLNRTAGPEYRTALMNGEASYLDDEVVRVMQMWQEMIDKGYFVEDANAYNWNEAADIVASGEAAMTLIGTYATGYWNGNGLEPVEDYDFFAFPMIEEDVPMVSHGAVNGWVIPSNAANPDAARNLIAHMITAGSQETWSQGSGALAASNEIDTSIYTPVMQRANEALQTSIFLSGYDLSTVPEMADVGLNMFARFMNDPSGYMDYLETVETARLDIFEE